MLRYYEDGFKARRQHGELLCSSRAVTASTEGHRSCFGSGPACVRAMPRSLVTLVGMRRIVAFGGQVLLPQAEHARRHLGLGAWWKACLLTPADWARGSRSLIGPARPNADMWCGLHAETSESSDMLKELQSKNKNLRVQLSKSPWPDLKGFWANGQNYSLPLRAESSDSLHMPSEAMLDYLAGFFDGDGCVSCCLSGCILHVGQTFDKAEVLMLFYKSFGGSIVLQSGGGGLCKPVLRWTAHGMSARRAAQLLAPRSITKRSQLLLAAQWPKAKPHRMNCKAALRRLKEYDSAVAGRCSWEFCAGFFDAEGCIDPQRGKVSLVLRIKQKHERVLRCLREFLAQSLGKNATLAKSGGCAHVLLVCGLNSCQQVLQQLLEAGLRCKARQAELAVGLTRENAVQVGTELGRLTGNQMFGKRLDAAGQERARKIQAAQSRAARLKRRGQLAEALVKLGEAEMLKQEHALLRANLENQQLVEYMRRLQNLHDASWDGRCVPSMEVTESRSDELSCRAQAVGV